MADGFDWALQWPLVRPRISLGKAVMRIWVGLVLLLGGLALAVMYFRAPPEPAEIEKIILAYKAGERLGESTIVTGSAARPTNKDKSLDGSLEDWSTQLTYAGDRSRGKNETSDPRDLARSLQAELKRVGCYRGAIDGQWGPMSRRAMAEFASRINANLPVGEPDPLLLRMVQSHKGEGCAATGYVAIREQPRSVEPLPGRMSVGGPVVAERERRSRQRPRVAQRDSQPSYRSSQRERRHWTETIFDDILRN